MRKHLLVALLLVSLLFVAGWSQMKPQQYEYKIEYSMNEKKLNQLAGQGWELVAVSPDAETGNVTGYYFKRAK